MTYQQNITRSNFNKAIIIIFASIIIGLVYSQAQLFIYGYKVTFQSQLNAYEKIRFISYEKERSVIKTYNEIFNKRNGKNLIGESIGNKAKNLVGSVNEYIPIRSDSYNFFIKKMVEAKNIGLLTLKIFFSKMIVIFMSLPLFLMTGCVGLVDGLSRREIRTAELGRESSYVFHRLSGFVIKGVSILMVGWLILPINIQPSYLFLVASLILMMSISMASSRFKKYL